LKSRCLRGPRKNGSASLRTPGHIATKLCQRLLPARCGPTMNIGLFINSSGRQLFGFVKTMWAGCVQLGGRFPGHAFYSACFSEYHLVLTPSSQVITAS